MRNSKLFDCISKFLILFIVGGFGYILTETLYRGYSHYTMFIAGGFIFILVGIQNQFMRWTWALTSQMLLACLTITICELIAGLIVNTWLDLGVWSYAHKPYNFMGQICLYNSVLWFFYSIVPIVIDDYLRYWLLKEEKPVYKIL